MDADATEAPPSDAELSSVVEVTADVAAEAEALPHSYLRCVRKMEKIACDRDEVALALPVARRIDPSSRQSFSPSTLLTLCSSTPIAVISPRTDSRIETTFSSASCAWPCASSASSANKFANVLIVNLEEGAAQLELARVGGGLFLSEKHDEGDADGREVELAGLCSRWENGKSE